MSKSATQRTTKTMGAKRGNSAAQRDDINFDAEGWRAMIAEAAYFRAERRGFAPGHELEDWLASESELNARLDTRALNRTASTGDVH